MLWHRNAIADLEASRLFQRKTGMHKLVKLTAKCVQVLRKVHIEKGQLGVFIVQQDADLLWSNCDSYVWSCPVVQKFIPVP